MTPLTDDSTHSNGSGGPPGLWRLITEAALGRAPAGGIQTGSPAPGRTARARAEAWIRVAWLSFRLVYLATGAIILLAAWSSFAHPWAELMLMLAVVVETAVLTYVLRRHRSATPTAAVRVDVIFVCIGLVLNGYALGPAAVDSWLNWFFALSLGTAVGASAWLPPRQALAAVASVALAHCLPVLRPWTAGGATGVGQVIAYSLLIGWLLIRYLRTSADETDATRAKAVELAKALAEERARRLMHENATVLRLLSQDDLSETVAEAVRRQGGVLAAKTDRYLAAESEPEIPLAVALTQLLEEFADLRLTANINGIRRDVPDKVREALLAAVRTLLLNVRCHAQARTVVLYASVDEAGWEVSVSDDGRGFDPATQHWGVGLREVVTAGVRAVGGDVTVVSAPGNGTGTFVSLRSGGHVSRGYP